MRSLQQYAYTHDKKHYQDYLNNLTVPLGDRIARNELLKPEPDMKIVRQGFLQGRIHEDDIQGLVTLVQRFHDVSYVKNALIQWGEGDRLIAELMTAGEALHKQIQADPKNKEAIQIHLQNIYAIDDHLTAVEDQFSYVLGAGSRWLENIISVLLFSAVLLVEGCGLTLTYLFSRNLGRGLRELNAVAKAVGEGNFDAKVKIHSEDELGQLAQSINRMTAQLKARLQKQEKAENANQLKTLFLANMSHEIRTPVGIIMGLTEVLGDSKTSKKEHDQLLETIRKTGVNLLRIINDILDISRVESGHLEIEVQRFNLKDFMGSLSALMQLRAKERGNRLTFQSEGELPEFVNTDPNRVHQILLNLINNSIKFTDKGEITVRYWVEDEKLKVSVQDNGVGIDEAGIEKLFHIFSQVDSSAIRKHGGSGLGLVLSKRLAQLLGGDVILQKTVKGQGSEFLATIRLAHDADEVQGHRVKRDLSQIDVGALKGRHVLVVEDNHDNQFLIRHYLQKVGMQIEFANDGREGVQKALAQAPQFVLMDMQMPVQDGLSATKELREKGFQGIIIALTANAMKEYRDQCLGVGCDDYLTKPIEMVELYAALSRHTEEIAV